MSLAGTARHPMGYSRVQVAGARHYYGRRVVLDGIDLELRSGEIYGLLGPNGAGKTTLMHAICGRLHLTSGFVFIDGEDPWRASHALRKVGFVPQDIALYPHLTVRENLAVFGRLAGVPRRDLAREIQAVIEAAGLGDRAYQLCRTLSGGYQRRVNIGASILHHPAVLILDEPTVGIDIDAREAVHGILDGLRAQGTAILLTTHDLDQAQALCDRIGILHRGRLVMEGVPATLLASILGADKEIIATLSARPDPSRAAALVRMGFSQSQNAVTWTAHKTEEVLAAGRLITDLAAAGITVKELQIREPDLNSLFLYALNRGDPS